MKKKYATQIGENKKDKRVKHIIGIFYNDFFFPHGRLILWGFDLDGSNYWKSEFLQLYTLFGYGI